MVGASHSGSFAGGFAKAFVAMLQLGLRAKQINSMSEFYKVLKDEAAARTTALNQGNAASQAGRDAATKDTLDKWRTGEAKSTMDFGNADRVYKYLTDKGVNPEAAKGFIGSLAHESVGLKNDALNPHDRGGPSGGWGQWHGDRWGDFTKRSGTDESKWTADDNFNMLKHELEDTDVGKKTMEELKGDKTIADGVMTGANTFEVAAKDTINYPSRLGYANLYNNYRQGIDAGKSPAEAAKAAPTIQPAQPTTTAKAPEQQGPALPSRPTPVAATPTGASPPSPVAPPPPATPRAPVAAPAAPATPAPVPQVLPRDKVIQAQPPLPTNQVAGAGPTTPIPPTQPPGAAPAPVDPNTAQVSPTPVGRNIGLIGPNQAMPGRGQIPNIDVGEGKQPSMPAARPANIGAGVPDVDTSTGGGAGTATVSPSGSGSGDPLWYGYNGASPTQAASADPTDSMYSMNQAATASAGLTDTSGLMAAGMMGQMAMADQPDVTANMWRGGPVIKYNRGGIVKRYAQGGDTDDDFVQIDQDDPMSNAYWDQMRVQGGGTNNSDQAPDLTTSIQNRVQLTPQDQQQLQASIQPPPELTQDPSAALAPAQPTAAPDQTGQPATSAAPTPPADTTDTQPAPQQSSYLQPGAGAIPLRGEPGSVQVAGPGGYSSVLKDTTFPSPRVGGTGGIGRMPRGTHALTGLGKNGNQTLYTPAYVGGEDFDTKGVAPLSKSDGSPSNWLSTAVDNGLGALISGFGIMNRGAIPGSQQESDNLSTFRDKNSSSMIMPEDAEALGKMYDPDGSMLKSTAEIGGMVSMIKYYALTGNLDAASRLAGGMLLYTRMMSMEMGDKAVNSLFQGKLENAVKYLEQSHDWVPNGQTATGEVIDKDKGIVRATLKDGAGHVLDQQDYLPAAIMEAALGAKNGTSYWNFVTQVARAGGNDPTGVHAETQRLLESIEGNQFHPPSASEIMKRAKDARAANGVSGVGAPVNVPGATPAAGTVPAPTINSDQTQGASAAPPIPPAGSNQLAMAQTPPSPAAPQAGALPARTDVPRNLVAGPGAPSNIQAATPPNPTATPIQPPGGATPAAPTGVTQVNQQQLNAPAQAQQASVDRMIGQGSFDPDDPYLQRITNEIQAKELGPLEEYRSWLTSQYGNLAGIADPKDRAAVKAALDAKTKEFVTSYWNPAMARAKEQIAGVNSNIREQFQVQMRSAAAKQAMIKDQYDKRVAEDTRRTTAELAYGKIRDDNAVDHRAYDGVGPDGGPLQNKVTGQIVQGYSDTINQPLDKKDPDDPTKFANPITNYIRQGNPLLSETYDGKDPSTFNPSKISSNLFTPTDRRTMNAAGHDMISFDKSINFRQAQDYVTGITTGVYTMQRATHPKVHSEVLGDMEYDDRTPRVDVYIGKGPNDPNPAKVTMSESGANNLAGLAQKVHKVTINNMAWAEARDPSIASLRDRSGTGTPIQVPPERYIRQPSHPPSSMPRSDVTAPPPLARGPIFRPETGAAISSTLSAIGSRIRPQGPQEQLERLRREAPDLFPNQ